jgi:AcrR family transcriptional regulator
MSTELRTRTGSGHGRPRDPNVDTVVLAAAVRLIARSGVDGWTTEDLTREAEVGKASIYRRWATRADIQVATVRSLGTPRTWDRSYSTVDRIAAVLTDELIGDRGMVLAALVGSLPHRPDLRAAWAAGPGARLRADLTAIADTVPVLRANLDRFIRDTEGVIAQLRQAFAITSIWVSPGEVRRASALLLERHAGAKR